MSTNATKVVRYSRNGFEDDVKFVEIDGAKFVPDETDPSKAKVGEDGKPVPFVEKKPEPSEEDKSLEELAKSNPAVAKLLDDKKKRDEEDEAARKKAETEKEEQAKKTGEWQKLAEERGQTVEQLKADVAKKEEMLGKYVGSVKTILKEVMETIPKENLGLIPDNFSPREKLEYITKNAKLLGAKVTGGKGGAIPPNENEPPSTEEAKLVNEIEELRKKDNKTQADHTKIFDLSKKLKEVRAKKDA